MFGSASLRVLAGTSNTMSPVLLLLSAHPLATSAPGLGALPQPGAQGRPLPPPRPRHAWHRGSWEDGPDVSQPSCPPAAPSHRVTPLFRGPGAHPGVVPSLGPESLSPSLWACGRGRLGRLPCLGLPRRPVCAPHPAPRPGPQMTSLPDSPTLLLFCSPALLPGLPSCLPSPAGLLLQEAFLDWEGIAAWCGPHMAAGTPPGAGGNADAQGHIQPDPRGPHAPFSLKPSERGHPGCSKLTRRTFWEAASAGQADWGRGWGRLRFCEQQQGLLGPHPESPFTSRLPASLSYLLEAGHADSTWRPPPWGQLS